MNWQRLWLILRPLVTLGFSLLVDLITKTDTPLNSTLNQVAREGVNVIIEEVDSTINKTSDIDFKEITKVPDVSPGTVDKIQTTKK